jgi:chemotaxis protein methyltransferase CheR
MNDQEFQTLLNHFGLSWKGYRRVRKGVKKRLRRHMLGLNCRDVPAYLHVLSGDEKEKEACERLLTVPISRFFRDRRLWEILEREILPEIIRRGRDPIRVWCAGCASGEEVYSLLILWRGLKGPVQSPPEVLATDRHPDYLLRARTGVYTSSSLREVPGPLRSFYFNAREGGRYFAVSPSLQKNITWRVHSLLLDPPASPFDLIFLRNNLLTYYEGRLKERSFTGIIKSLASDGFLVIGAKEKLPLETDSLTHWPSLPYIYTKASPS